MILQDVFREKERPVTADPEETLGAVVEKMYRANVGAVVMIDGQRKVVGIITDRDAALALGLGRATPESPVSQVMTKEVVTIWEGQGVLNATQYLYGQQVRRLPVVDAEDRLVGMVTLDDLLALLARELYNVSQALEPALHEA